MWEHTQHQTRRREKIKLTHKYTNTLPNLIGPVPDTLRIIFKGSDYTGKVIVCKIAYSADPCSFGSRSRRGDTHTSTHTQDVQLVHRAGCMKQTTRGGKRTSSGILHFNYSKWHFLGQTIRDCHFPFSNQTPLKSFFSVLFWKVYVFLSTSIILPSTRPRQGKKHQSGFQFLVLSAWRIWFVCCSVPQTAGDTRQGKSGVIFFSLKPRVCPSIHHYGEKKAL